MAALSDIKSSNWTPSLKSRGDLVQGNEVINQSIKVIFETKLGSNPLRLDFGSKIYQFIDKSMDIGIPAIKAEIKRCLGKFETRITVGKVSHEIDLVNNGKVLFSIPYLLVNSESYLPSNTENQNAGGTFAFDYEIDFQL